MCGEAGEFVGMRTEGQAAEFADFSSGAFGEFGMRVEARANGRAADGEVVEPIEGLRNADEIAVEQADPAGKFLAHGERCSVLQMGAADFDDPREFFCFGVERVAKFFDGGQEATGRFGSRGNVHGRRERVIRGLRHVDVVIGMDGFFAAQDAAREFDGAVADDFVDVHVGLRAAAGLPNAQGEVIVELA